MIVFNNVTKKFGDNVGLINASVHIKSGDFVFLVGPSGAGKTTFMKAPDPGHQTEDRNGVPGLQAS